MMRFWFENSLLFTANSTIYPEASISESRIYDGQFNLITNQYPSGKVLDMFHTINISKDITISIPLSNISKIISHTKT